MARTITIDRLGRVVVPQDVRRRLGLSAGSRLLLRDEDTRIVLEPEQREPMLREDRGILVLEGVDNEHLDHRTLREDRIARALGRR